MRRRLCFMRLLSHQWNGLPLPHVDQSRSLKTTAGEYRHVHAGTMRETMHNSPAWVQEPGMIGRLPSILANGLFRGYQVSHLDATAFCHAHSLAMNHLKMSHLNVVLLRLHMLRCGRLQSRDYARRPAGGYGSSCVCTRYLYFDRVAV